LQCAWQQQQQQQQHVHVHVHVQVVWNVVCGAAIAVGLRCARGTGLARHRGSVACASGCGGVRRGAWKCRAGSKAAKERERLPALPHFFPRRGFFVPITLQYGRAFFTPALDPKRDAAALFPHRATLLCLPAPRDWIVLVCGAMAASAASKVATREHIARYAPTPEAIAPARPAHGHGKATLLGGALACSRTSVPNLWVESSTVKRRGTGPSAIRHACLRALTVEVSPCMTVPMWQ
jgi:hypothetical protein